MFRQVHPNSLRSTQHAQAEPLQTRCLHFHEDYDTLKWEFASNKSHANTQYFDAITGNDDYKFAILRDEINYLVEATTVTLGGANNASHGDVLINLTGRLNWFIKKSKELKSHLEGEGHTYRDGIPEYKTLGPTTTIQHPPHNTPATRLLSNIHNPPRTVERSRHPGSGENSSEDEDMRGMSEEAEGEVTYNFSDLEDEEMSGVSAQAEEDVTYNFSDLEDEDTEGAEDTVEEDTFEDDVTYNFSSLEATESESD